MKNNSILKLHEAIVVAIINIDKETYQATFQQIANHIEKRSLFEKSNMELAEQVKFRSTLSKKQYYYLFEQVNDNTIRLKFQPKSKIKV